MNQTLRDCCEKWVSSWQVLKQPSHISRHINYKGVEATHAIEIFSINMTLGHNALDLRLDILIAVMQLAKREDHRMGFGHSYEISS